jgi:heat-inducible transcriptional repressor
MLSKRQKRILRSIIHSYIDHAVPVASDHIARHNDFPLSTATIRNEMLNLEKMGYLHQVHTSGGRIPTDKGYRFYVDSLMQREKLDDAEKANIQKVFGQLNEHLGKTFENASRILGKISNELGIICTPWMSHWIFDRMDFVGLSLHKVLVVIHVQDRRTKTLLVEVESDLYERELEMTRELLNERLSGLTLEEIQRSIHQRMRDTDRGNRDLLRFMINSAEDIFNFEDTLDIHACGTQNIIGQPEFANPQVLSNLMSLLENREELMHLLRAERPSIHVTIGEENPDRRLKAFSIIRAPYRMGQNEGVLGIIGPTRMPYARIFSLVDHMSSVMSSRFS